MDAFLVTDYAIFFNESQYKVLLYLPSTGRNYNAKVTIPNVIPNSAVRGELGGQKLHLSKACPRLPNTAQYNIFFSAVTVWPEYTIDNSGCLNWKPHFGE